MAKKNNNYYDTFAQMTDCSYRAALYLQESLQNFDPTQLQERMDKLHAIEHESDLIRHAMMRELAKEFITPIEREDIIEIVNELDDITDRIEDVLIRIYMYNISSIREEAIEFTENIVKSCAKLKDIMEVFPNFRKSTELPQYLIDVNTLESEADQLYIRAIHNLFSEATNPIPVIAWQSTFEIFEKCSDSCEHAANSIECVIMKNS